MSLEKSDRGVLAMPAGEYYGFNFYTSHNDFHKSFRIDRWLSVWRWF